MEHAPTRPDARTIRGEVLVVLSLSVLASAAYAIVSLFQAPLKGVTVTSADQNPLFANQLIGFVFGLAPVALVIHLLHRDGEGAGVDRARMERRAGRDLARGVALFAVVGTVGLGIYIAAVKLGVNRFVVPAPPDRSIGGRGRRRDERAAGAALLEEVVVLAYLVTRLRAARVVDRARSSRRARCCAPPTTCTKGGAVSSGNLLMGALFAVFVPRWRRAWPFVICHFLIDASAAAGWLLSHGNRPGLC